MTTQPPFTGSDAQVNTSAVEEMFAGKSVACPCCNGNLTPSMLQQIMDDASCLEGFKKDLRAIPTGGLGMMIDPHAHMTARTTDDYEARPKQASWPLSNPPFGWGKCVPM